jgi:hypothetical protein
VQAVRTLLGEERLISSLDEIIEYQKQYFDALLSVPRRSQVCDNDGSNQAKRAELLHYEQPLVMSGKNIETSIVDDTLHTTDTKQAVVALLKRFDISPSFATSPFVSTQQR